MGTQKMNTVIANEVTVEIGLPPKELDPNGRFSWQAKIMPKKRYQEEAYISAILAMDKEKLETPKWDEAFVTIKYYHKTKNFRDTDNIIASMKAVIDGIVHSGLLADDNEIVYLPVQRFKDKENPGVKLVVKKRINVTVQTVEYSDTIEELEDAEPREGRLTDIHRFECGECGYVIVQTVEEIVEQEEVPYCHECDCTMHPYRHLASQ